MPSIGRSLLFTVMLLPTTLAAAPSAAAPPLVFRIGFWNNLHQFLYVLGRAQNHASDAQRKSVANAPSEMEALVGRPEDERAAWQAAVDFYAAGPSKQDLVFDKDLIAVTSALAGAPDNSDLSGLQLDPQLATALRRAARVYRGVWWDAHRRADEARRGDLEPLVATYGQRLATRLSSVYHATWPAQPRVINLAAYTNWAGAYSTDGGLIEFASKEPSIDGALGLEILFHESSHQWDAEMAERLEFVARAQQRSVPDGLLHALIFYTSGAIVKELIPEHVAYAEKFGLWNRGALRGLEPVIAQYWSPYLRGQGTIDGALANVIAHVQ
jgi:hypothetical protein